MSDIKYKLRRLLPRLKKEKSKKIVDLQARRRFLLIEAVAKSPKDILKVCQSKGYRTQNFYYWARRLLKEKSPDSLCSKSKAPKSSPNKTLKRVENKILRLRRQRTF